MFELGLSRPKPPVSEPPQRNLRRRLDIPHASTEEREATGAVAAARRRLDDVGQRMDTLNARAKEVFALKCSKEASGLEETVAERVSVHYKCCLKLLKAASVMSQGLEPQKQLIQRAHTKCDFIAETLNLPVVTPALLCDLPEPLWYRFLSPLLGTQSVLVDLARAHPSLHSLSRRQPMHRTVVIRSRSCVRMTWEQSREWLHLFSRTEAMVIRAAPTVQLVMLVERAAATLKSLEACCRGQRGDAIRLPYPRDFFRLTKVKVSGGWVSIAHHRNWTTRPLEELDVEVGSYSVPNMQAHFDMDGAS
ncbi:unnamed protein product [Vitrella brassicaformis CCMP3155]|uniref:Uncharacterized protein n=1 Tax=Vitrella brassicaformis (strain CCMP3155) TaxID=1169540 RepID=A0A0G4ENP4_VITBC|nr:unnamed protein product [Vitrella brassicaformis CCMP3155]|eukprot:CEL98478.1 unnamed protein product [Vitrella brassicaformis CCMP3155]